MCATCNSPDVGQFIHCNQVNNDATNYCSNKDTTISCSCSKLAYNAFPENAFPENEMVGLEPQRFRNVNDDDPFKEIASADTNGDENTIYWGTKGLEDSDFKEVGSANTNGDEKTSYWSTEGLKDWLQDVYG